MTHTRTTHGVDHDRRRWDILGKVEGGKLGAERFVKSFDQVAEHDVEFYNDDEQLGTSVLDAVALSKILEAWPAGLQALVGREKKDSVADLVPGEDGIFRLAEKAPVTDEQVL